MTGTRTNWHICKRRIKSASQGAQEISPCREPSPMPRSIGRRVTAGQPGKGRKNGLACRFRRGPAPSLWTHNALAPSAAPCAALAPRPCPFRKPAASLLGSFGAPRAFQHARILARGVEFEAEIGGLDHTVRLRLHETAVHGVGIPVVIAQEFLRKAL